MTSTFTRLVLRSLFLLSPLFLTQFASAMQLGVSLNPDRVRAGEVLMATLTVTNDGATSVNNAQVQAQIPATNVNSIDPSYASGVAVCSGNCDPSEYVTWSLGVLAPGQGVTVSIPLVVFGGTTTGSVITMPTRLLVGGSEVRALTRSVTVNNAQPLALSVDVDKDGAAAGETLTYDLTYGNRSSSSILTSTLSFPVPAGSAFVSASGGGTLSGNVVSWPLNTLLAGQSGRTQVVVTPAASLPSGSLLEVQSAQLDGISQVTGAETARAAIVSRVQSGPALGVAMSLNADPVRPGELLESTVTVTNRTDGTLSGSLLKVRLPSEQFNSLEPSYINGGAVCSGNCDPSEFVNWTIGTLAPRASVSFSVPLAVFGGAVSGRAIGLQAEAFADGVPMAVARHTVAIASANALSLAVDANRMTVAPGERLSYDLVYGNRSPSNVTGTTLVLPLPSGTSLIAASGNPAVSGNVLSWNLATLLAGQSGRQQVVVAPTGGTSSGSILSVNAATIAGTSTTTGGEVARATQVTVVQAAEPLGVAIAMNADPSRPGEPVASTITATNRSDQTVFGAVLTARMPVQRVNSLDPVYLTGSGLCSGNCDPAEFIHWNVGALAPHASATYSLPVQSFGGDVSGTLISLEARFEADGVPAIDTRHTVAVDADNALSLALAPSADSVAPGSRLTYTLTYANRSNGTVNGAVLSFPVPDGAVPTGSSGGAMTGSAVSWNLGSLVAGAAGQRTVTVQVAAGAASGWRLAIDAAQLTGTSPATGAESARAMAITRVMPANPLVLSVVSLTPGPVLPSSTLTGVLRVTNSGATPLVGVVVQARVPSTNINSFAPSVLSPGGSCPGNCDPFEFATWSVGTLQPGASSTVNMPMPVFGGATPGRLVTLDAFAIDDNLDQSSATSTVPVGSNFSVAPVQKLFGDFDGNGLVNFADLAMLKAAFGSNNAVCDLNGDGVVNFADLALFKSVFGL